MWDCTVHKKLLDEKSKDSILDLWDWTVHLQISIKWRFGSNSTINFRLDPKKKKRRRHIFHHFEVLESCSGIHNQQIQPISWDWWALLPKITSSHGIWKELPCFYKKKKKRKENFPPQQPCEPFSKMKTLNNEISNICHFRNLDAFICNEMSAHKDRPPMEVIRSGNWS